VGPGQRASGMVSIGIGVEYAPDALPHTRKLIAEVNKRMPTVAGAPSRCSPAAPSANGPVACSPSPPRGTRRAYREVLPSSRRRCMTTQPPRRDSRTCAAAGASRAEGDVLGRDGEGRRLGLRRPRRPARAGTPSGCPRSQRPHRARRWRQSGPASSDQVADGSSSAGQRSTALDQGWQWRVRVPVRERS
jgi:hypothetical protein